MPAFATVAAADESTRASLGACHRRFSLRTNPSQIEPRPAARMHAVVVAFSRVAHRRR